MIDENVNRFCELIVEINEISKKLDDAKANFYDGGYSFERCYSSDIEELIVLQIKLKKILRQMISEPSNFAVPLMR